MNEPLPLHRLIFSSLDIVFSSVLSLHVLGDILVIYFHLIDYNGWTGSFYWCDCRHGYPDVVRALKHRVVVVYD